jgi:hypothetical protein
MVLLADENEGYQAERFADGLAYDSEMTPAAVTVRAWSTGCDRT